LRLQTFYVHSPVIVRDVLYVVNIHVNANSVTLFFYVFSNLLITC